MGYKEFFKFNIYKLVVFLGFGVLMNLAPKNVGVCVDGIDFGYCIQYYGFPFKSFIITGEIQNIPADHLSSIISKGILGALGNLLIAYLIVSIIFYFIYSKKS